MQEPAATDEYQPIPKRFWWLKRLLVVGFGLMVLLVGLRLVWGQVMQSRLDQTIADIQAKGEPILFDDLVYEAVPDGDNGAWYMAQAMQTWPNVPGQFGVTIDDTDWYIEGEEAGYTDPITDNAAYLTSCQAVFDLLRQADEAERSDWGSPPTRPLFYMLLPQLHESRRLARLVEDAARRALEIGDTELVFESMLMQYAIARHVLGQYTVIIDSLVSISIMSLSRDFIEQALPKMDPDELREGRARELAKETIARLTDGMTRDGLIRAYIGERAGAYDYYECLIDGTDTAANLLYANDLIIFIIDTPGLSYAYRPAIKDEQRMTVEMNNQIIAALENNEPLSFYQDMELELERKLVAAPWRYPISYELMSAYSAAVRTQHRNESLLHCAAVAIAIKLYEADHGKRPATLDELVPKYITAIPADPFSKTGEAIRYNPAGITPVIDNQGQLTAAQLNQLKQQAVRPYPVLYSVGEDGNDQLGKGLTLDPQGNLDDTDRFNSFSGTPGDIWFMLDPWPEAIFTDQDLGITNAPLGLADLWEETLEDADSETGEDEQEVQPDEGQSAEDQNDQPQP